MRNIFKIAILTLTWPIIGASENSLSPQAPRPAPTQTVQMKKRVRASERLIQFIGISTRDLKFDKRQKDKSKPPAVAQATLPQKSTPPTKKTLAKNRVFFNESAPKGKKRTPPAIDDSESAKRSAHRNPPIENSGGKAPGIPQRFDSMWPVCVFIDPAVGNANQIIKEITDMAAACSVNLVAFPFYIKPNYPADPAALNTAAKRSCNAIDGMAELGISRASVVTLVSNSTIAARMCAASGNTREVNSCAEVGYPVGEGQKARMASTGTWGGQARQGEAAAAIVGPGGLNAATVAGRLQGQGQMALPWGSVSGNGTGDFGEGYATAGSAPEKGWSNQGCDLMRKTAFHNTGNFKYLPTREDYVALGKTLWDIQGERTVFNTPASPDPKTVAAATPARINNNQSDPFSSKVAKTPDQGDILPASSLTGEGHKLRAKSPTTTDSQESSSIAAQKTETIPAKLKIGGQLNALDNRFMTETSQNALDTAQRSLTILDSNFPAASVDAVQASSNPTLIKRRIASQSSQLDPGYLLKKTAPLKDKNKLRRDESLRKADDPNLLPLLLDEKHGIAR